MLCSCIVVCRAEILNVDLILMFIIHIISLPVSQYSLICVCVCVFRFEITV